MEPYLSLSEVQRMITIQVVLANAYLLIWFLLVKNNDILYHARTSPVFV